MDVGLLKYGCLFRHKNPLYKLAIEKVSNDDCCKKITPMYPTIWNNRFTIIQNSPVIFLSFDVQYKKKFIRLLHPYGVFLMEIEYANQFYILSEGERKNEI